MFKLLKNLRRTWLRAKCTKSGFFNRENYLNLINNNEQKEKMIKIYKQNDGEVEKLYCQKQTIKEALKITQLIKENCIIIGEGRLGFYAKATQNSTPFSIRISKK
jgi:hypothetical protein